MKCIKKMVFLGRDECLLLQTKNIEEIEDLKEKIEDRKLAIQDLKTIENIIYKDLTEGTEQFVFNHRKIPRIGLCVSTFFTYDTDEEIEEIEKNIGSKMDRLTELFISVFPYENGSILLMGYEKQDEIKVKEYIDDFFKESNEEICYKKLTNLIIFNCENKVFNNTFYNEKIKGIEYKFIEATKFMLNEENKNQRRFYDINFYSDTFKEEFTALEFKI